MAVLYMYIALQHCSLVPRLYSTPFKVCDSFWLMYMCVYLYVYGLFSERALSIYMYMYMCDNVLKRTISVSHLYNG